MLIIQVYTDFEANMLLGTERTDLSYDEIEEIIKNSSKFTEEEEGMEYLNENGIERIFIDIPVYL